MGKEKIIKLLVVLLLIAILITLVAIYFISTNAKDNYKELVNNGNTGSDITISNIILENREDKTYLQFNIAKNKEDIVWAEIEIALLNQNNEVYKEVLSLEQFDRNITIELQDFNYDFKDINCNITVLQALLKDEETIFDSAS